MLDTIRDGENYWYWIGSHGEYDKLINLWDMFFTAKTKNF